MSIWDNRPEGLSGNDLIAWALCQVADAFTQGSHEIAEEISLTNSGGEISLALGKLTDALIHVAMVEGCLDTVGSLEYIANRVGGNLERIADHIDKLIALRDLK